MLALQLWPTVGYCYDGQTFTAPVTLNENNTVQMTFKVISEEQKTVQVGNNQHCITNTKIRGSIVIPSTVKGYTVIAIGGNAFYGFSELTSIEIPNEVNSIGYSAFYRCSSLTAIEIPNTVTSIGSSVFNGCTKLTSISIPNGVTSIEGGTFFDCSSLTSIVIPNSITSIGPNAFYGCHSLTSVIISDIAAWCYISFSGVESNPLHYANRLFLNETEVKDLVIPNNVSCIGNYAFYDCGGLTSIEIPNSVNTIGNRAFMGCGGLTTLVIPNSVDSIGNEAFACEGLVEVEFHCKKIERQWFSNYRPQIEKVIIGDGVTSIGDYAFSWWENLSSIEISNTVTSIGDYAFLGCSSLTSIKIPDGVKSIPDHAFSGCKALSSALIPESVIAIGKYAFYGCKSLTSFKISASMDSIGSGAFSECTGLLSIEIYNMNSIDYGAFSGCDNLEKVSYHCKEIKSMSSQFYSVPFIIIGSEVTTIGDYAFSGYNAIKSIVIPNSVTTIGNYAFKNCKSLTTVTLGNNLTSICNEAFENCESLSSIEFPNSLKTIGDYTFNSCKNLSSLNIPNSVICIGECAFQRCNLTKIVVESGNPIYDSRNNCNAIVFSENDSLVLGCKNTIIPNSVKAIGERAFTSINDLYIVIPDGVETITRSAFYDCQNLSVEIPNSIVNMSYMCFSNYRINDSGIYKPVFCDGMKIIFHCKEIKSWFFDRMGRVLISEVKLGNEVTNIDASAFQLCKNLTKVEIPNSVTSIGNSAFSGCSGLTSVVIPNSVTSIGDYAFHGCSGLTSVVIPNSVTSIGDYAFWDCSNLTSIEIPNSVTSIGYGTFQGCSGLTSVEIPDGVTSIGGNAFTNCSGLISVEIPNSMTSIGSGAFRDCSGLTTIISHILEPFECYCFDYYNDATLYVPAQSIMLYRSTHGWNYFKNIRPLALQVIQTELIRKPKQIHIHLMFSSELNEYTSLDEYISLASKDESLKLLLFAKSGQSYDLYFENPKKEGVYTLKVSNAIMNVTKQELDQNGNGISGEDDDNYTEDFVLGNNELYVVAQSPITGVKGEKGYTDVVLNDEIGNIPVSQCSLLSPSRKYATITKIEYLEDLNPARHRIYYDALDEDGIYTFTLHKGIKSAQDWDMRYDYQSTIELPCADLTPVIFTGLGNNHVVGQTLPVTYQVENKGNMLANGNSVNVLYLSITEEWSNEAIEIYRDIVDVHVESQESYSRTIDVTIPPCLDGQYYLILKTNVARTINELSYDDNTMASEAFNLSVDWLSDDNSHFTLARGESRLFKIPVTSDKNIEVIDKDGNANMYVGYGVFPDTNNGSKKGSVIILRPDESMTYYLLVSNDNKNQEKSQPCELSIRQFDIDIASVGRESVVKHKTAWIPIEVKGCTDMPTFYLTDSQGKRTECKNVRAKTESSFYAQFDTEELRVGKYTLYVECDGKTGMMPSAITIKQEEAQPSIDAKLVLPSTSRIGSTITAHIDYKNTGNVDVPVPLFILSGEEGSCYTLDGNESVSDEAHIIGVNEKGVMSALLPGESNWISVDIEIPNKIINNANYNLKTITDGCDGIDEPFYLQWLDVDPDENPNCYTDEEWDRYCTRLRNNVGDTWLTFIQALGTVADMYFSSDNIEHDAHFLYDILKETDLQAVVNNSHNIKKKTPDTLRDVEAGTLFVWKNGQWNQVVNGVTIYDYVTIDKKEYKIASDFYWEPTENIKMVNNSASKNFIISHGWNDDRNGNTILLAQELEKAEGNCNIFGIDWSKKATYPSYAISLGANKPALEIPDVADKVINGLCTIFGAAKSNLRINNLHLIGHSHGAHLCGLIAHNLKYKPKRLTALDASQQWSHVGWSNSYLEIDINYRNFMGSGWSSSDVQFLDYYKSSVMAGTNRFKGNNNFILIESDNGFAFDKFSDEATETIRHGYSISWFAQSILNKDLKIGYNLSPNYLKDNWGSGYNENQYHGVIHGSENKIEIFSIRDERNISNDKWNYTEPWYGKQWYQNLGNDRLFRDALALTIEYDTISIDPYYDGNNYLETGTTENVKVKFKNTADNFTIPLNIRENEVRRSVANALFITNSNNSNEYFIVKNKDGISEVRTKTPIYLLGYDTSYGDISKDETKESEANISFNISTELWNQLAGKEKDKDYIYCDLWFIPGSDKSSLLKGWADSSASMYYTLSEWKPLNVIQLWKGELYSDNNVIKKEKVKVQRPTLECDAGKDRTYKLGKGQKIMNINVNGIVERDNGMNLSYYWEKDNSVFSNSKNGNIPLRVGSHTLTFHIKAQNSNNTKVAFAPASSANEASDNVIITIKPYTPGDEDDESTNTVSSWDPNEKVGIKGAGGKSCVRQGETMEYAIYFENDAEKAQLAAQTVTVIDTLDTAFDLSTFEFTGSEVANTIIDIPSGKAETIVYTDLRPANNLILKTDMKLDIDTRELKVVYSSLDTLTYEPTQDVFAGFLPPNDSTHIGEGHFSYRVKLKDDVADGYVVKNQAHIFFDYNDEIATNITNHTIDSTAPISAVDGLPSETEKDSIMVSWSGIDEGAGIKYFDVYRSKNGGGYELWKSHVTEHSAILYGVKGDVYRFYSVATDSLNFVETMKNSPDATITFTGDPSSISTVGNETIGIEYQNGAFVITGAEGATCNIYDLAGQLVASKQRIARRERMVFSKKGVYVVNVETTDGVTVAKKMVVK